MTKAIVIGEFSGIRSAPTEELPYDVALRACLAAKSAGLASGDAVAVGHASKGAVECYRRLGRLNEARDECDEALRWFRHARDWTGLGWAFFTTGSLLRQQSRFRDSYVALARALEIATAAAEPRLGAYALAGVAETTRILGDYSTALLQHRAAYRVFLSSGDLRGEVWALEGVGQIYRNCDRPDRARDFFARAQRIASQCNDKRGLAYALKCHGECLAELGHLDSGLEHTHQAVSIFHQLGFKAGLGYSFKALGDIFYRRLDHDAAAAWYGKAADVFENMDDGRGLAYTINGLAAVQAHRGDGEGSGHLFASAHAYFAQSGIGLGTAKSRLGARRLAGGGLLAAGDLEGLFRDAAARARTEVTLRFQGGSGQAVTGLDHCL